MPTAFQLKRMHVENTAKREEKQPLQPLASSSLVNTSAFSFGVPTLNRFTFTINLAGGNKENVVPSTNTARITSGISAPATLTSPSLSTITPTTPAISTTSTTMIPTATSPALRLLQSSRVERVPYVFDPALGQFGRGLDSVPLPPIAFHYPRRIMRVYAASAQSACGTQWKGSFSSEQDIDWTLPVYLGARVCQEILEDEEEVSEVLLDEIDTDEEAE